MTPPVRGGGHGPPPGAATTGPPGRRAAGPLGYRGRGKLIFYFFRESDIQHVDTNRVFHTPGIFYRPEQLKTMTALLGNTETRSVFKNFRLENLNSTSLDFSHQLYEKYLQHSNFIPPGDKNYFLHLMHNRLPSPPSLTAEKGLFNLFPLDLSSSDELSKNPASTLGTLPPPPPPPLPPNT